MELGYRGAAHADTWVCLDIAGGSQEIGGNLQQWRCNDLAPQVWRFDS